jgi:hypothetical protein
MVDERPLDEGPAPLSGNKAIEGAAIAFVMRGESLWVRRLMLAAGVARWGHREASTTGQAWFAIAVSKASGPRFPPSVHHTKAHIESQLALGREQHVA